MKKLAITTYNPQFSSLPEGLDGFTIAHISDLHNANFDGRLENEIKKRLPNIIVITGDMVHKEHSYDNALKFAEKAVRIAPVYYVNGNHEGRLKSYPQLRNILQDIGIIVLENETRTLTHLSEQLTLIGINDIKFFSSSENCKQENIFKRTLADICAANDKKFRILLTHRPELFDFYADCGVDLTLAGHTHGGQVRLPSIGAVFVPGQGIFPKYADGLREYDEKYIVISRGLWHTRRTLPRIFNTPELVFVRLGKK